MTPEEKEHIDALCQKCGAFMNEEEIEMFKAFMENNVVRKKQ